ncbi:unnamed protein product [Paramecium pentaurelia]|uniref:Uncharacterized protein n=1 Tax=Paramecium pentaurelia TaxID=43138 RepID=A0A8S1WU70_9CILI|nr:unnamed protein product [Paramecium pentaurelia]
MKERVSDIQNIYNNSMAIKQIKYREKLRQIQETDIMSSLYQFRKLTQQDLAQFQEGAKQIFKIIAPGFDTRFSEITLTSTSKVFIELYQHFGFVQKSDTLYNELLHNSKQQIFLCLIQHLIDLTKIALKCAVKRFLDMKLFCIGKEIEKSPILLNKRIDMIQFTAVKKNKIKRVMRSESNSLHQSDKKQELRIIIDKKDRLSIHDVISHCDKSEIIKKNIRNYDEINIDNISTTCNRNIQRYQSVQKHTEPTTQRLQFPSIYKNSNSVLYKALKTRNQSISLTISNYIRELQDKGIYEE